MVGRHALFRRQVAEHVGGLLIVSAHAPPFSEEAAIVRGPMVHKYWKAMLDQCEWGELDYLVIDLPPGTGDAQLTLCQETPLTGGVVVTTPQDVSLIDARKGLQMFRNLKRFS